MATEITPTKIKALISDPKNRIELHELVHKETERLHELIVNMNPNNEGEAAKKAKDWIEKIEVESKTLRDLFAYGCYFGTDEQANIWLRSLNRLGNLVHMNGLTVMVNLQLYPAMLALYTGGVSAVAAGNGASLKSLLTASYQEPHSESGLLVSRTHGWLIDTSQANTILERERRKTPLSDHDHDVIASNYPDTLIVKDNFALEYDRWEVLLAMIVAHHLKDRPSGPWAPVGRFAWRRGSNGISGLDITLEEIEERQLDWPPLRVSLFNGSIEDAKTSHEHVKNFAEKVSFF